MKRIQGFCTLTIHLVFCIKNLRIWPANSPEDPRHRASNRCWSLIGSLCGYRTLSTLVEPRLVLAASALVKRIVRRRSKAEEHVHSPPLILQNFITFKVYFMKLSELEKLNQLLLLNQEPTSVVDLAQSECIFIDYQASTHRKDPIRSTKGQTQYRA